QLAGAGRQQVHIRLRRVQHDLAGELAQLALVLPDFSLGIDPFVNNLLEIELATYLHAAEQRSVTGVNKEPMELLNAAFMAVVGRTDEDVRQPILVRLGLLAGRFLNLGAGLAEPRVLVLGQVENGLQTDGDQLRGGRRPGSLRRGRARFWWRQRLRR